MDSWFDRFKRDLGPWGLSLLVNLSILAGFGMMYLEAPAIDILSTIVGDTTPLEPSDEFEFNDNTQVQNNFNTSFDGTASPSLNVDGTVVADTANVRRQIEEILNPEVAQFAEVSVPSVEGNFNATIQIRGDTQTVIGGETGVEGAVDRVAYELSQSLKDRRTLVIWMMDASGSLEKKRNALADRIDVIYEQLGKENALGGLHSSVVAFGQHTNLLIAEPTQSIDEVRHAIRNGVVIDQTGIENTFGALKLVLEKFRNWDKASGPVNKKIIILTDERGDDANEYLEEVISLAKRSQTKIYTIGNAAIFGQEKAYLPYEFEDGYVGYSVMMQGPDTAFPEGLQLPLAGAGQDWRLTQMSSSYGPYALTRVCAESGGLYLVSADTQGYSFDPEIMRRYSPDYRPYSVQLAEINKHPAKAALVRVAGMTYQDDLPDLLLEFRAYNDNLFRTELVEGQKGPAQAVYEMRRMLEAIKAGENSRDSLQEDRWRAAFDLAMGRLLAMQVRYFGYNQTLAMMSVNLKSFDNEKDNMWRLAPAELIETGPEMRKAAEEAQKYLKRVVEEHPGTPWAFLAQKELDVPLGWQWIPFSRPIPGTNVTRANEQEVAQLILADANRRRAENMRRPPPTPRPVPRL